MSRGAKSTIGARAGIVPTVKRVLLTIRSYCRDDFHVLFISFPCASVCVSPHRDFGPGRQKNTVIDFNVRTAKRGMDPR